MNSVPLVFAETVVRLLDYQSLSSLEDLPSGLFGNVGRSFCEKRLVISLNVFYNFTAKTFEYCLSHRRSIGNKDYGPEPYTYDPADRRFVRLFAVKLLGDRNSVESHEDNWISTTPSDPTLLKLLRAPFPRTFLYLGTHFPEFLKMLPDYCTFNSIYASYTYNEDLDAIIERSQECGRLEKINCWKFFSKRGRNASIDWILTNKRLMKISCETINTSDVDSIKSALTAIGVK